MDIVNPESEPTDEFGLATIQPVTDMTAQDTARNPFDTIDGAEDTEDFSPIEGPGILISKVSEAYSQTFDGSVLAILTSRC